jgi:hypothetical protein
MNPLTGRFLSRDPEDGIPTDPSTLHKYNYAGGDPINLADPTGRAQAKAGTAGGDAGEYAGLIGAAIAISLGAEAHPGAVQALGQEITCAYNLLAEETGAWVAFGLAGLPRAGQVTRTGDCTAQFECKNGGTLPGAIYFHYGYSSQSASFAGGLWPGSYATTVFGLTGSQAKTGLALPHEAPPNAVYVVKPAPCTPIVGPTPAEPKYGQPGGLPEVQFPEGTVPGTIGPPIPILPGGPALPLSQ